MVETEAQTNKYQLIVNENSSSKRILQGHITAPKVPAPIWWKHLPRCPRGSLQNASKLPDVLADQIYENLQKSLTLSNVHPIVLSQIFIKNINYVE